MLLRTKGFKGKDAELEISGLKIAVGLNGSGKSALLDALRFLALGFVPALGKRPQDTAALMPDEARELSVELSTEGGSCRRLLARKDRGFEAAASCSWLVNAKPSEQAKAITGLFGKEEIDVAEVLDLRELINATPNQRAARLEALVAAGKRTPEALLVAVKRLIVQRLAGIDDERMAGIEDYKAALPMVPKSCLAVLEETADLLAAKVRDAGLAGALAWSNEGKRLEADGVNRREQAAKELRIRAAEVDEPNAKEIQALETERAELDRKTGAAVQQAAGFQARAARRAGVVQAHAAAEIAQAAAQEAVKRAQEVDVPRIQVLEALVAKGAPEPARPAQAVDSRVPELRAEAERITGEAFRIPLLNAPSLVAPTMIVQGFEAELKASQGSPWMKILDVARRIEDTGTTKGIKDKLRPLLAELREIVKDLREDERDPVEIRRDLAGAQEDLEKIRADGVRVTEANQKAEADRAALRDHAKELLENASKIEAEVLELNRSTLDSWQEQHAAWERERADVRREWSEVQARLKSVREAAAVATQGLDAARKLLELQGAPEEAPQDPGPMAARLAEIASRVKALQEAAAVHAEIQRAIDAIEGAKARRDTFAAIEWALQRERQTELAHAGGAFLEIVAGFLKAGGREEVPFIKAGAAVGWTRGAADILVQAMSGGEWALFVAAMTTAALVLRDARLRVLLVEADSMDDATLRALVAGVVAFLPKLSGAIVTTWRRPTFEVAGVEIVDMGAALSPSPRG